ALFAKIAPSLGVQANALSAGGGMIVAGNTKMSWKQACSMLGALPMTTHGANPGPGDLNSSGVGGVQMAEVSVDVETGVVSIDKIVAVQDCGLIIDRKTTLSQCYGSLTLGIGHPPHAAQILG